MIPRTGLRGSAHGLDHMGLDLALDQAGVEAGGDALAAASVASSSVLLSRASISPCRGLPWQKPVAESSGEGARHHLTLCKQ